MLTDRIAVVTGAAQGIGEATALALASLGAHVAVCDRQADGLAETVAAIEATGRRVLHDVFDVRDADSVESFMARVAAELGPIDILVNNAGITRDGFFHKMSHDQWSDVIRVNMDSVFNMTRQVINGMRDRGHGRIVNISSINGQKGQFGQVNYAATKAGDLGIVKSLAQEGARFGITANAICPGYIATEMVMAVPEKVREAIIGQIPAGRLGEPEEIARGVKFLVEEDAGFVNGSTISANGAQFFV